MKFVIWFALLILLASPVWAQTLPPDVLSELNSYNVTWTSPSPDGSPGSMPIGNGDITANVWVENNGGDLVMYLGKSDSWSEGTRLLKIGRLRFHFSPNPFASGLPLSQTLNYYNGEMDITAGQSGSQVSLRVYVDANQPVLRVVATGQQNFSMTCSNEIWRTNTIAINSGDSDSYRGVSGASPAPSESADQVVNLPDRLLWYHQNGSSYFDSLFTAENLNGYAATYIDPWIDRIFGAAVLATNFSIVNGQELQSPSGTNFMVSVFPYTEQTPNEAIWQSHLSNIVGQVSATPEATARTNHYAWWDAFWNRSWIFVSGDIQATNVTSGYLAQRYVQACQGRGAYPIKFNGGIFTFDNNGENGDYRAWGPGYWNQNTRLIYWPMLAAGDFDMMAPYFNIYTNMLPVQMAATEHYYNHGGAFFPETFNIFGLYYGDDWGWNNTTGTYTQNTYIKYHYSGGLDTLAMMLSYYDYTQDSAFATNYVVPFATQAIRFFEDHWSKVNGKYFFYPANACEMYWSCTNSADYISGLMSDIQKLTALPSNLTTPALITEWSNCYNSLPPLPMDPTGSYVKPAQTYGAPNNAENPECYCIFPYRLYGLGLPNYNVGLATFVNRTVQSYKYDWSQDPIEEALIGLTSQAQTDVINNFNDTESGCRYQAFWNTRSDYVPTEDTGGAAMSALQYMLMQCVGTNILLLPSWPVSWNVDFKLCAAANTTVRLILQNGTVTQLTVTPSNRAANLVETVPAPPTGVTGYGGNSRVLLSWNSSQAANSYNVARANSSGGPYTTVATGLTSLNYLDTGLTNNTNYFYVVTAADVWGDSANSAQVSVAPGSSFAVHWEGDLLANLQSSDLTATSHVWTNRTSAISNVGNFSSVNGQPLQVASMTWNSQTFNALDVNDVLGYAVESAHLTPAEILKNNPVSAEAWVYASAVSQQNSCVIGYGVQGGSSHPEEDREFNYSDPCCGGGVSGNFGTYDTQWGTAPAAGAWHYLAWTYDGITVRLYLDGQLNANNTPGSALQTSGTVIGVGAGLGTSVITLAADPFQGYIAAARVESGVLTAQDIAANYAMGPLGTATAITPGGLTGTAGDGQASLSWAASSNATNYNVKRSSSLDGTFANIATNLTSLAFTNIGLTDGTTYYYTVSAVNSAGESAASTPVSVQPVSLTPPTFFVSTSGNQVQLSWPQNHTGWALQAQTNSLTGTNWVTLSGSTSTNQIPVLINPTNGSVYFRLVYP